MDSGTSSSHRQPILRDLEHSGVRPYFDVIVTGEDTSHSKPDPEIFQLAAGQLGLDPSDCYVFEDSFNGVRAGHAAGCCTMGRKAERENGTLPVLKPFETVKNEVKICFETV